MGDRLARWRRGVARFVAELFEKGASDNIFFLASGLTFSLTLAAVPFLILLLSVAGLLLAPEFAAPPGLGTPEEEVLRWLWELIPVTDPEVRDYIGGRVEDLVQSSGSVGLVSGLLFAWFSTRLFGALRTVLGEVFDLRGGRGVVKGKLADIGMVLVSTVLLVANIAMTSVVSGAGHRLLEALGISVGVLDALLGLGTGFLFLFIMYLLIYKFVPARRLPWRTAGLAALLAAVSFELLKAGFGWYLTNFADYQNVFFAFATIVVLVISLYYTSTLFVLSGEIAQLVEERRIMARQREVFDHESRSGAAAGSRPPADG